ncbi:AbrB family transcriptional regulator [Corynebacterium halotolerans]|uniref:Ammonia monooxygenase n=1 Tax=Corynebacterium halotolerans YIM 70093 = DSM 44683 TaxID=1121362 RepID=M1MU33_9CORY|nr:AbrB family transcriptional regulator [Corynebacterium halotolerans]AGF71224.1 ammonia monooxygenase [Corynebacterium halotolerans YIM 70093 = DSM 44683]
MFNRTVALRWMIVAPLSLLLGWLFTWWQVPASWILAAIVAAGACALITGDELPVSEDFYGFGRGVIGILAAVPLVGVPFAALAGYLLPGLAVAVVTLGVGVVGGLLLARSQARISRETGILSMLAGGASVMPVLARELGADFRFVSLTQYLRLLAVSVSLPLITALFPPPGGGTGSTGDGTSQVWWVLLIIVAVALFGARLGRLLHLPVPSVLGPLLITVVISLLLPDHLSMAPPEIFRVLAFLSIGWMCGGALSIPALKAFSRQLPATVTFIVVIIGACALTAVPLTHWLNITYFEAYLATSPGALETVLALSSEGGAGPAVVALQLIRLLSVLLLAGWLPQLIRLITRGR